MSVRNITTNQLVNGYVSNGWYNGRKSTTVRQRCNLVGGTFFALNYQLPPRSRIVWGEVLTQSAVTLFTQTGGPNSNAPDAVGLMVFPATAGTSTAPFTSPVVTATLANTSLSGPTNGFLCFVNSDLTTANSNTQPFRGLPQIYATNSTNIPQNTHSSIPALVALVPMRATSGIHATAAGFNFGANTTASSAGTVDVTLYIEEYEQAPYA